MGNWNWRLISTFWNEGNRAASGRGRSASPRFVGKKRDATTAGRSQPFGAGRPEVPRCALQRIGCEPALGVGNFPGNSSGERFSDGVAVRFADVTTCYPGQLRNSSGAAHDGIVRNRHKVGKRARPTYQPALRAKNLHGPRAVFRKVLWKFQQHGASRCGLKPRSLPSPVVRGCAARFSSATNQ